MILIAAALALLGGETSYQGELKERLNAPVIASFETAKRAYDLEICVADALTVLGTPTVFRDGAENIVIAASFPTGNAYLAAVSVARTASGSHLDLRLRGKGWDDRIKARITECL